MRTAPPEVLFAEPSVVLHGIRWETYQALLHDLDSPGVRLTYDDGELEIMTISSRHERIRLLVGRMIEAVSFEHDIPIRGCGATTHRRQDLKKGLEPDECYYILNELSMRGKEDLDLLVDPPPDLVVEVQISRRAVDKLPIYAAMGVPEVWLCGPDTVKVHVLGVDGQYAESPSSPSLPFLPMDEVNRALLDRDRLDDNAIVRVFLERVRERARGARG